MPCLRATVKMRREWSEVRSAGMEGMGREGNGVRWSEVEREERGRGETTSPFGNRSGIPAERAERKN